MCIPLLEKIPQLEGRVITGDAMLASRDIARYILGRGGHYLFDIRNNQKNVCQAIEFYFEKRFESGPVQPDALSETGDEGTRHRAAPRVQHGRRERRRIWTTDRLNDYIRQEFNYPGVEQVFRIEREVHYYRQGKVIETSMESTIGITSLTPDQASAETLLSHKRGHWSIETVHHILDHRNNWNEDHCRIRTGFGPENMSALRRLAISVIQRMGKPVAPTLRKLRCNARMVLDYLMLTANTQRRTVCRE